MLCKESLIFCRGNMLEWLGTTAWWPSFSPVLTRYVYWLVNIMTLKVSYLTAAVFLFIKRSCVTPILSISFDVSIYWFLKCWNLTAKTTWGESGSKGKGAFVYTWRDQVKKGRSPHWPPEKDFTTMTEDLRIEQEPRGVSLAGALTKFHVYSNTVPTLLLNDMGWQVDVVRRTNKLTCELDHYHIPTEFFFFSVLCAKVL